MALLGRDDKRWRKKYVIAAGAVYRALGGIGEDIFFEGGLADFFGDGGFFGERFAGGSVFHEFDRLQEAEKSVGESIRWKSDSPEAYLLLADIHNREKNYSAVLKDLGEYLKLDPDSPTSVKATALRDKAQRELVESQASTAFAPPQP